MSALPAHVDDYLRLRRALGFKLERDGQLLPQLVGLPRGRRREHGHQRAGVALGAPAGRRAAQPRAQRLAHRARLRRLPAHDRPGDRDPAGRRVPRPPPPPDPLPVVRAARSAALLDSARALRHPLRAATYEALFGLLAASGMRVGEAIGAAPAATSTSTPA